MNRAQETATAAGQAGQQVGGDGQPLSRSQRRGLFEVDEDAPLDELERAWAAGGYHGFGVLQHSVWSAISSCGVVLTGNRVSRLDRTETHA